MIYRMLPSRLSLFWALLGRFGGSLGGGLASLESLFAHIIRTDTGDMTNYSNEGGLR